MTEIASAPVTPERIMQLFWSFAPPLAMEAATTNGVFDALADAPKTAVELSSATGANARGLRIICDLLVGLNLLTRDEFGRYALAAESREFLVKSSPRYLGGFLKHLSGQVLPSWIKLSDIVRTGLPAAAVNDEQTGAAFFHEFVEDLFAMNYAAARTLGEHLHVANSTAELRVLDLAAGSGVWSIALAELSPLVRPTAVDWAGVIPTTKKVAARRGVAEQFSYIDGDLLEVDFGTGYHIAALGHILHSEGEARSQKLLTKTHAALASGGTIAIAEFLVNEERSGPMNGLVFAVNMLVNTRQGDAYSFGEIRTWLEAAGFVNARLLEAPAPSPLILATKG